MRPFILYSKFSAPTAKSLMEALGWAGGRTVSSVKDWTHIFRWGCGQHSDIDQEASNKGVVVHNPALLTRTIVNREHMFRAIEGCRASHQRRLRRIGGLVAEDGWLGRHRFGRWGDDIVDMRDIGRRDLEDDMGVGWDGYFTIEKWLADHEVRVHIVDGESVSFQVKCRKDADGSPIFERHDDDANKLVIRNDRNGWHLYPLSGVQARKLGINKDPIRETAKGLMSELCLSYGCVDFLVRVDGGAYGPFDYRVLEINTAPGLDGSTLETYASAFKSLATKGFVQKDNRPEAEPDFDEDDDYDDDFEDEPGMYVEPIVMRNEPIVVRNNPIANQGLGQLFRNDPTVQRELNQTLIRWFDERRGF